MEEKKKDLTLNLVKREECSYKIIISEEVEKKIRILCKNIWNLEWSGILFYKVEGRFVDGSLSVRCVDILQMDIGSPSFTSYTVSPDIIGYMVDHPELLEEGTYQGLIH